MRGLLILVVAMGVLIVAGVATIAITIVHRMSQASVMPAAQLAAVLDEPAGTRIAGVSGVGDRIAVTLQGGGGPDRVVILDPSGHRLGAIQLAR